MAANRVPSGEHRSGAPAERAGTESGEDLATHLGRLARELQQEVDLQATLDAIVHAAVDTVPGAEHASITSVVRRDRLIVRASTDELARQIEQSQLDLGEGPCVDTLLEQATVRMDSVAAERRWDGFAARAEELGVQSMLCLRLFVRGGELGALNLHSTRPHAFTDVSEHIALLFATHAAVAMAGAEVQEQLRDGLERRDIIGQAMGILMERYGLTAERAFAVLARLSKHTNRKLHLLAEELVRTRLMPDAEPEQPGRHRN